VQAIVETTSRILDENRPKVAHITAEASVIAKVVREQTERIGELIDETNARAHTRIAQIDHAVDQTIGQVEQASETVKSAVMRPAKEVNGILNGVKAALNTYAEGRRRPSVDHATQDEEMFI
jgi:ABC-type transporter Mla subunit MlaD